MSQIQSYRDTSHNPTYASPLCRFVRGTNKLTGACEGCCGDHMMCTKWEAVCGDFLEAMKCVCGISTTASHVLVAPTAILLWVWVCSGGNEVICSGYDIIIWILQPSLLVWNLWLGVELSGLCAWQKAVGKYMYVVILLLWLTVHFIYRKHAKT